MRIELTVSIFAAALLLIAAATNTTPRTEQGGGGNGANPEYDSITLMCLASSNVISHIPIAQSLVPLNC